MAYASWSVVFGEQPSAAKWNILGTNDAYFNDTLTGSGTINTTTLNNPYKFRAYATSSQTSLSGNTWYTVSLGTEDYDTGNVFASNTFTAPVTGYYQFNGQLSTTSSLGLYIGGGVRLYKNNATAVTGASYNYDNNTSWDVFVWTVSDLLYLTANDTIVMQGILHLSSGTAGFLSGQGTNLSGYLVSKT